MKKGGAILVFSVVILLFSGLFLLSPESLALNDGFDREKCIIECNELYGGEYWFTPAMPAAARFSYNRCLQECERKAWKTFDKDMDKDLK